MLVDIFVVKHKPSQKLVLPVDTDLNEFPIGIQEGIASLGELIKVGTTDLATRSNPFFPTQIIEYIKEDGYYFIETTYLPPKKRT